MVATQDANKSLSQNKKQIQFHAQILEFQVEPTKIPAMQSISTNFIEENVERV